MGFVVCASSDLFEINKLLGNKKERAEVAGRKVRTKVGAVGGDLE